MSRVRWTKCLANSIRCDSARDVVSHSAKSERRRASRERKEAFDAAVGRGRQQDNVLMLLGGDFSHQLMAMVLAWIALGRRRRAVGFIDDHKVGAVEQEVVSLRSVFRKSMLATWNG